MSTTGPVASIVVCTHNRRDLLPTCLESLLADTSTVERELVIVDNASTDGTADYLRDFSARPAPFPVRSVFEPALGLSNARNTGLRATTGEFMLFTDDDVWVDDGWADAMVAPFDDPDVGVVGGRVVAEWPPDAPEWAHDYPTGLVVPPDIGSESRPIVPPDFVVGASLGLRRLALQSLTEPVFDPLLGVRGGARFLHEEVVLLERLSKDWAAYYTADAVVHHPVFADRMDLSRLSIWALQAGVSSARADAEAHEWRLSRFRRMLRFLVTAGLAALHRLGRRKEPSGDAVRKELEAMHWTGRRLEYLFGPRYSRLVDRVVTFRVCAKNSSERSSTALHSAGLPEGDGLPHDDYSSP